MSRKKKRKDSRKSKSYSTIDRHRQIGKTLVPPLAQLPKSVRCSWATDRLPDMLWAALLLAGLDREHALAVFRSVADWGHGIAQTHGDADITHSGLSRLPPAVLKDLLGRLCADRDVRQALRPLGLLASMPARECWQEFLGECAEDEDWQHLKDAVGSAFDHQSQVATDCRWLRVLFKIALGKMCFQQEMKELVEWVIRYPNQGDLAMVRPFIRSAEGALAQLQGASSDWPKLFWEECRTKTTCELSSAPSVPVLPRSGTTVQRLREVYCALAQHFHTTNTTTTVDAKHDTVFGLGLYSLAIVRDLLGIGAGGSVLARMGMRSLIEGFITLAYLLAKDTPEVWMKFRNYGTGQAKLAFLKLDGTTTPPDYVSVRTLEELANEDMWQEFVEIGLGHWDSSDLRKMSEEAGVKDDYDRFYGWTSGYVHAQWGAVRDTAFGLCYNPLHRFHRIPRPETRGLPDVIGDAVYVADKILDLVARTYPGFDARLRVDWNC